MSSSHVGRRTPFIVGLFVAAACSSTATPTPAMMPNPSMSPTSPPPATADASVSSALGGPGRWLDAGTMSIGRRTTHALLLGDGSVLAVGNDEVGCVRADSVVADRRDPATGAWSAPASLNKPRGYFAAVALTDGRALVTGGVNAGVDAPYGQVDNAAYSSTYVYDPADATAEWTRASLLGNARVAPAAATLPDGRVLVAGGFYLNGRERSAAAEPGPAIPALATAELYDPSTAKWSGTDTLRFARFGAQAAALADGRVLVVGSGWENPFRWGLRWTNLDDRVYRTAEIYNSGTGRFVVTGDLPAVDWSPLSALGSSGVGYTQVRATGALVALADGGALLVGHVTEASTGDGDYQADAVQTLRFDPNTDSWSEIDREMVASGLGLNEPRIKLVPGHSHQGAFGARLADGRILVAGGLYPWNNVDDEQILTTAAMYDPGAGTWTDLPELPSPRAFGIAVTLNDGSVLVLGGTDHVHPPHDPAEGATGEAGDCTGEHGLASVVRYVPSQ